MKHGLLNLTILIICLLVISSAVTKFLEVWLLDNEKKRLREKFETWWLTVSDYDRLQFALICTRGCNRFIDVLFGNKLFSKRAFLRCSFIATGLLIGSLALTGLLNHRLMAISPWENYHQSCELMRDLADVIGKGGLTNSVPATNSATGFITITNSFINSPTTFVFISTNDSGEEGELRIGYYFGKKMSDLDTNLTQAQQWSRDLEKIQAGVEKYDTKENATIYSITYFIGLFLANVILCFFALVLARIVLREICASARIISALSLLVSNFFLVLFASSFSLFALLVCSIPVFWLLLPLAPILAKQSLLTFIPLAFGVSLGIWAINCVPLNVVVVLTFLPGFFAVFAIIVSLILIIGKNPLHRFISSVLLRCAEKSPTAVIGAFIALIIAIVTALAQLLRGTF